MNTISFSKTAMLVRKNVIKKVDNLVNLHFSKTFDNVGRILTGLKFSFIAFLAFLCTGVMSDNSKEERKLDYLIALLMLVHKKSTNISIFSLLIIVGISVFCEVLVLSKLRIFFRLPQCSLLRNEMFCSCYIFELKDR